MLGKTFQIQTDASDAIHATVCNISLLHGLTKPDIHWLRKEFFTGKNSDRLDSLRRMLLALGLTPVVHSRVEVDQIQKLSLPCLTVYEGEYVILRRLARSHAQIVFPRYGQKAIPLSDFHKKFSGLAIEVQRSALTPKPISGRRFHVKSLLTPLFSAKEARTILALSIGLLILSFFLPLASKTLLDTTSSSGNISMIGVVVLSFAAMIALEFSLGLSRDFLISKVGNELMHDFKYNIFHHAIRLPMAFYSKMPMSLFLARFAAIPGIKTILAEKVLILGIESIIALGALGAIAFLSWQLAVLSISFLVLYGICFKITASERVFFEQKVFELYSEERLRMQETIESLRAIRIFRKENERMDILHGAMNSLTTYNFFLDRVKRKSANIEKLLMSTQSFLVLAAGSLLVMSGSMEVSSLFALIFYQKIFIDKSYSFVNAMSELTFLDKQVGKFTEIIGTDQDQLMGTDRNRVEIRGEIELKNVTFRYDSRMTPIFSNLNMSVKPGESVAIVGPSGAGKSTLFQLITGLLKPESGDILIDGRSIWTVIDQYRSALSIVQQEDRILGGTISQNVAFTEQDIDMDRVIAACKKAQIHDFIMGLPCQYDTTFDIGVAPLSGGQKQRLLIARALYCQPRILLLDEASSALDIEVEQNINRAIQAMECTRIIIAHRPDTIRMADRILHLTEKGLMEISKEDFEHSLRQLLEPKS